MLRVSVVLLSVLCVAYASKWLEPVSLKPEKFKNVPGCYIEYLDEVIPLDQWVTEPTTCWAMLCGETHILFSSCPAVHAGPRFKLVQDKTEPYPFCCPNLKPR